MDLTTTARVKALAKIDGTSLDSLIGTLISGFSAAVEDELDRALEEAALVEIRNVSSRQTTFRLRGFPVLSSPAMTVHNDTTFEFGSTSLVDTTSYQLIADEGVVEFLPGTLIPGRKVLQFSYTGGMGADTAAFIAAFPQIAEAVDIQLVHTLARRNTRFGASSVSLAGEGTSYEPEFKLIAEVKRRLQRHKRFGQIG